MDYLLCLSGSGFTTWFELSGRSAAGAGDVSGTRRRDSGGRWHRWLLPGCGFPTGQLLGLFNPCTGHLVRFVVTSWKLHEAPLARQLVGWVNRGEVPGFRTNEITLVTALLDQVTYPDASLAELYRRRWQIEVCFRDIKTTLGLDVLRTQTPAMIDKEIHLQAIAYNVVRALMLEAARQHDLPPCRLSFKGTVGVLHAFAPLFDPIKKNAGQRYEELLLALACAPVPLRPNRSEPRAVKRRPKPFQLLTKPRRKMIVSKSLRRKSPITPFN